MNHLYKTLVMHAMHNVQRPENDGHQKKQAAGMQCKYNIRDVYVWKAAQTMNKTKAEKRIS